MPQDAAGRLLQEGCRAVCRVSLSDSSGSVRRVSLPGIQKDCREFCGLPGLILEAHDRDYLFTFHLVGLMSNPAPKKDWLGKGKKTDRISFLKKNYQYLKNLSLIFTAETGIDVPQREDTRYLDGLEPDFK